MINDLTVMSGGFGPEDIGTGTGEPKLVEISVPPELAKVHVGDCYSDTRSEIIHEVRENVKRIRKGSVPVVVKR